MEGRSAIFWLEFFPVSVVTCIDTFEGIPELQTPYTRSQVPFAKNASMATWRLKEPG